MNIEIILIQIILGICLFFLMNWIGKHSYSIGYMEISIFSKIEEELALNFLIRVLPTIVYLVIVSSILYYFGYDKYVQNIFLVNLYYIIFRLLFNLLTNRRLLINWYRQFLYWISIIGISYLIYDKIIKVKANIFPDFTTVANELWIIIIVFIFHVINNIRLSQEKSLNRKQKYIKSRFNYFKKLYGKFIKETMKNEILEVIVYSILIYEDFNRPKIARIIENIKHRLTKKPHTLGVMQVSSNKIISDLESVKLGTQIIINAYHEYIANLEKNKEHFYEYRAQCEIISNYNGGSSYQDEVQELISTIKEKFYNDTKDTLDPSKKTSQP